MTVDASPTQRRLPLLVRLPIAAAVAVAGVGVGVIATAALLAATTGATPGWLDHDTPIDFLYRHPMFYGGGLVTYAAFMVAGVISLALLLTAYTLVAPGAAFLPGLQERRQGR